MRRRKGPEAPATQVVSGQEAAVQQGYVPAEGEQTPPAAQAPPPYSAFYQQTPVESAPAPVQSDGVVEPPTGESIADEPAKPR
jgi:hypothetical protein